MTIQRLAPCADSSLREGAIPSHCDGATASRSTPSNPLARHHLPANMDWCSWPETSMASPLMACYEYKVQGQPRRHLTGITGHSGSPGRPARRIRCAGHRCQGARSPSVRRDLRRVLSDWTDENPTRVLAKLKKNSRTTTTSTNAPLVTSSDDVARWVWSAAVADSKMWAEEDEPTDLAGRQWLPPTLPDEWPGT